MTTIALFGAAGKMGTRISRRLKDSSEYNTFYVEAGEAAQERLRQQGLEPTNSDLAASQADVAILSVPDRLLG